MRSGEILSPNRFSGQGATVRENTSNMIGKSTTSACSCWNVTILGLDVLNVKSCLFPIEPTGLSYRSGEL